MMERREEIFKMAYNEYQIPFDKPEVESIQSSDERVPETDAKSSFRTSPLRSPSYQFHLLRLSSDSDDCFDLEAQTPFSPYSMEFEISDQIQSMEERPIKGRQTNVRFDGGGAGIGLFMVKMEIENEEVDDEKLGQENGESRRPRSNSLNTYSGDNPAEYNQPTGQANPKEASSNTHSRASRRRSNADVKKENEPQTSTTHQNTVPSDFKIPSTSHLALRRKIKRQASQDPPREKCGEQKAQLNRPVPLKSPRKSPVRTTRKNSRKNLASKTPRTAPIQAGHFVYPEISSVPLPLTKKTCVCSEKAYRQETPSLKDGQTERSTQKKNGEIFREKNRKATIPSLPKILQPRRRRQSRDQEGASVACDVAPQSPRHSPSSHKAGLEQPLPRCISDEKTSVLDPNAVPSNCVIPPTSSLALRRKLKRGMSNPLAAESREKSPKQKGISSQEPRLLLRPAISPNHLSYPLLQKSPKRSPRKSPRKSSILATRKINQLSRSSKSPRSGMAKHSYFVYPDIQRVPRPPTRKICLGSSGRVKARQDPQRYSSSNAATQGTSLSPAARPSRLSCPVPQKSPRKSPVSITRKTKQSIPEAKTPKSVTVKHMHFVYPEIPRRPRPPTKKNRLGSSPTWERKPSLKDNQTVTPEKHREAPKQMASSVSSLPKISNVQPTKQISRKKREKTLLEICNALSPQKRTV